jgi:hypothetical protein
MKANVSGRVGAVRLPVPFRSGHGWVIEVRPVAYYPGETEAAAESFAAAIRESFQAHRAAWLGRERPDGTFTPPAHYAAAGTSPAYARPARARKAPREARTAGPAPAATGRPSCPRCGRSFRRSGVGLAWHLANYPGCAEQSGRRAA